MKFKLIKGESPANSPDLNPIELMFGDLKLYVAEKMCTNLEVRSAIGSYRKTLTPEKCASFISHLYQVRG